MGGSAFSAVPAICPRMPPLVYAALKERLLPTLESLYTHVTIPREAPGKKDYGDLDFTVAFPRMPDMIRPYNKDLPHTWSVPHDVVQRTLGARYTVLNHGNRTSNFAVPIARGEWEKLGYGELEGVCRKLAKDRDIFYQVDIHVCCDKNEWNRVRFFNGYGDLGMILGVLGRNYGLSLGLNGLKMVDPPNKPVQLSKSFHEILQFLGLSMDRWEQGFETKQEIFEWVAANRFFDRETFETRPSGSTKVKGERSMYHEFINWVVQQRQEEDELAAKRGTQLSQGRRPGAEPRTGSEKVQESNFTERQHQIRNEALIHFGKKDEVDALAKAKKMKQHLQAGFNSQIIETWVKTGHRWADVKKIKEVVMERCGGEAGVLKLLDEGDTAQLKEMVHKVKAELGV